MIRSYPYFHMAPDLLHDPSSFSRHYDPDEPSRYQKNFVARRKRLNKKGRVLYVDASGGGLLQMLGVGDWESLKSACYALLKEPRMVEDLLDRTTNFYCVCMERVLSKVPVDYASFYEPIASNTGPVISPAMFERFAIPGYRKILNLLKTFEVPLRILSTTGGNLTSLLPPLIEVDRGRHQWPLDQQHQRFRHGILLALHRRTGLYVANQDKAHWLCIMAIAMAQSLSRSLQ